MSWRQERERIDREHPGEQFTLPVHVPPIEDTDGSVVVGDHVFPSVHHAQAVIDSTSFELSAAVSAKRYFEQTREKARVQAGAKVLNRVLPPGPDFHHLEDGVRELLAAIERGDV